MIEWLQIAAFILVVATLAAIAINLIVETAINMRRDRMGTFSSRNWKTQRKRESDIVMTESLRMPDKPKPKSKRKPAPKKSKAASS